MTILTSQSEGLLLYASGSASDYLTLVIVNGFPSLRLLLNSQLVALTSSITVDDDMWHTVSVSRAGSDVYLMVDGTVDMLIAAIPQDVSFDALTPLYVGGVPFFSQSVQEASLQTVGFSGCIRDFQIQRMRVDIVNNALSGVAISQCPEPVCSYVICQNGATCVNMTVSPGFMCSCQSGYTGEFCETLIPLCIPNPCNGGLCSQEGVTFSCLCPLETGGRTCDQGRVLHISFLAQFD